MTRKTHNDFKGELHELGDSFDFENESPEYASYRRAQDLLDANKIEEALPLLKAAYDFGFVTAGNNYAVALMRLGQVDLAQEILEDYCEVDYLAAFNLADIYIVNREYSRALPLLKPQADSGSVPAQVRLAECYENLDEPEYSLLYLEKATKSGMKFPVEYFLQKALEIRGEDFLLSYLLERMTISFVLFDAEDSPGSLNYSEDPGVCWISKFDGGALLDVRHTDDGVVSVYYIGKGSSQAEEEMILAKFILDNEFDFHFCLHRDRKNLQEISVTTYDQDTKEKWEMLADFPLKTWVADSSLNLDNLSSILNSHSLRYKHFINYVNNTDAISREHIESALKELDDSGLLVNFYSALPNMPFQLTI